MLILTADDFGLSASVNAGVAHCFDHGLCTSASIMPNMPGFEEACQLVHKRGLEEHIGLHLVLTEGEPLTVAMRENRLFCPDGRFGLQRSRRVLWLTAADRRVLADEIRAQAARCRRYGLPLTHLDSHNHAHEEWAIGSVVIAMAKELAIPRVRMALTFTDPRKLAQRAYRWLYNRKLQTDGVARSRFFGSEEHYRDAVLHADGFHDADCEVMLHPLLTPQGLVIDALSGRPVEQIVQGLRSLLRCRKPYVVHWQNSDIARRQR